MAVLLLAGASQAQEQIPAKPPALLHAQGTLMPARTMNAHDLLKPLPSTWSYQELGLFCKLDVQLERRLKMPVLLRLGDAMQVEAWEGKGPLHLDRDR